MGDLRGTAGRPDAACQSGVECSPGTESPGSSAMDSVGNATTRKGLSCLLVTDAQHDFSEGSLAVPRGSQVAEKLGEMLRRLPRRNRTERHPVATEGCLAARGTKSGYCDELTSEAAVESISHAFEGPEAARQDDSSSAWCDLVVFSLDWHPPDHVSFVTAHSPECIHSVCYCGGRSLSAADHEAASAAVDEAMLTLGSHTKWTVVPKASDSGAPGASLVCLWPPHCVQGTPGAKLHRALTPRVGDIVVRKGTNALKECFSAGGNADEPTGLVHLLRSKGVENVAICGFCLEYCVAATAIALRSAGIPNVVVLTDYSAAINEGEQEQTVNYLAGYKVRCRTLKDFTQEVTGNVSGDLAANNQSM